jgi:nucleoside-diphosphate-sugar epimerase
MQILITGRNGYLGSRLAESLSQSGHKVLTLTRAERELPDLVSRLPGVDGVIHTACCYGRRGESDAEVFAANVDGPMRLLKMLPGGAFFLNTDTVLPPALNSYAASKALFRQAGAAFARVRNIRWLNVRLAHFFGPGEGMDKFVTRTVRACLDGAELKLTRGEQRREFIFIDDVVRAFDFVLRFTPESWTADDVYAGSGNPIRIRDLAEQIHRLSGSLGRLRFGAVPLRKGEPIEFERPDVEPLERFGWYATVELQNGLEQVVQFEQTRRVNPCACW